MRLGRLFCILVLMFAISACVSKSSRSRGFSAPPTSEDISRRLGIEPEDGRSAYLPGRLDLRNRQGRMVRLHELRGKVLLIDYFTTYAQPSQYLTPIYDELYRKYKDRGFVVVGVSLDAQGWTLLDPFIEAFHLSYPIYVDAQNGQEIETPFGGYLQDIPTAILVNRDGEMIKGYIGVTDLKKLEKDILKQIEAK